MNFSIAQIQPKRNQTKTSDLASEIEVLVFMLKMSTQLRKQSENLTIIADDHSIALHKLTDERIENLHVDDNGWTTRGSPCADVHHWVVDLAAKAVCVAGTTPRLIGKRSQPIDVAAVVTTILDALKNVDATSVDRTKDGRPYQD